MRRLAAVLGAIALGALGACEFDEVTVPTGTGRPVVHLVINPFPIQRYYYLQLERTLGGRVVTVDGRYDPDDPIVSAGGEPIVDADVRIFDVERGGEIPAIEALDTSTTGKGKGVYFFENVPCGMAYCPPNAFVPRRGATYELRVTVPGGERLVASATVPVGVLRPDTGVLRRFDATADTYVFSWPGVEGLARYAVQLQTPYGPLQVFSDVESLAVNGSLRNFQQSRLPRAFVPGFRQALNAFAVDRAYFDYYRSANDAFTGQGLVSNVRGGSGVFGAVTPIRFQFIEVVAPFDDPEDGEFELVGGTTTPAPRLTVYVDGAFASAKYYDLRDPEFLNWRGALGSRSAAGVRLHVLRGMSARDTAWTYALEYRGDTLVTTSAERGTQRWRRVPRAP